jgi:hypothetical protein
VGTAVCVELLDADELDGVGEEGREGVGVVVEEESVCELVLDDLWMAEGPAGVGLEVVGTDGTTDAGAGDSLTSDVRCCSCRDASDAARRWNEHQQPRRNCGGARA